MKALVFGEGSDAVEEAGAEVGLRVLRSRGFIVQMGLSSMGRCEIPWYSEEAAHRLERLPLM